VVHLVSKVSTISINVSISWDALSTS
jgi:hypothetical protein